MSDHTDKDTERPEDPGATVRGLLRRAGQGVLATALARDGSGRPYASLSLLALDHDASPVFLLSDLADHSQNLAADPRAALLVEETAGLLDPLTGSRATLLGELRAVEDAALAEPLRARYIARHPSAETYAGFADFKLYRMTVESAHLVAGFGRIHWLQAEEVLFDARPHRALAEAEPGILAHMNADHAEALELMARRLLGRAPGAEESPWIMTGIDPEGLDLRRGAELARLDFGEAVSDAPGARARLVELAKQARQITTGSEGKRAG